MPQIEKDLLFSKSELEVMRRDALALIDAINARIVVLDDNIAILATSVQNLNTAVTTINDAIVTINGRLTAGGL